MRGKRWCAGMLAVLCAAGSAAGLTVSTAGSAWADGPGVGAPWVVSVGDSYISGEAGRWAGNTDDDSSRIDALGPTAYYDNPGHTAERIPRCHRSQSAEIYLGGDVHGYNLACSGAETKTLTNSDGYFKPGIDFYHDSSGHEGQARMLQDFAAKHNVKMVALSIGGNDFDFGSIVQTCVQDFLTSSSLSPTYCSRDSSVTDKISSASVEARTEAIAGALRNVHTAMSDAGYSDSAYTIVVQDYPSPIPHSSGIRYGQSGFGRQTTGGCGFWNKDADWADSTVLPTINGAVFNAVKRSGLTNTVTLDISSAFNGRRLCEKGVGLLEEKDLSSWKSPGAVDQTEWIDQIRTLSTAGSDYFVQESLHPNYWGQLALRDCLRHVYNDGSVHGGTCTLAGTGLNSRGEPRMKLTASSGG